MPPYKFNFRLIRPEMFYANTHSHTHPAIHPSIHQSIYTNRQIFSYQNLSQRARVSIFSIGDADMGRETQQWILFTVTVFRVKSNIVPLKIFWPTNLPVSRTFWQNDYKFSSYATRIAWLQLTMKKFLVWIITHLAYSHPLATRFTTFHENFSRLNISSFSVQDLNIDLMSWKLNTNYQTTTTLFLVSLLAYNSKFLKQIFGKLTTIFSVVEDCKQTWYLSRHHHQRNIRNCNHRFHTVLVSQNKKNKTIKTNGNPINLEPITIDQL